MVSAELAGAAAGGGGSGSVERCAAARLRGDAGTHDSGADGGDRRGMGAGAGASAAAGGGRLRVGRDEFSAGGWQRMRQGENQQLLDAVRGGSARDGEAVAERGGGMERPGVRGAA